MKYVRFIDKASGQPAYGIFADGMITAIDGTPFESGWKLTERRIPAEEAKLLPPSPFSKAVCIGLNYRDHAEEFGLPIPETPVVFLKPSTAAAAHGDAIIYPAMCHRLDYEAELAVVIGKKAKDVSESEALGHVLGYTIANDVTARDLQPKNGQWTIAKGFDTFMPLGPYISDEVDHKLGEWRDKAEVKYIEPHIRHSLSHLIHLPCNDTPARRHNLDGYARGNIRHAEGRHSRDRDRRARDPQEHDSLT